MPKIASFILLHLLPLLLACTAFTLVTAPLGLTGFNWDFASYCYANGWGYTYHSDYTFAQVLMYLLAYGTGMFFYSRWTRPRALGIFATLVCLAGTISFFIELTHWAFDHHLSLILSLPIVLLPIAIWTIITLVRQTSRPAVAAPRPVEAHS